MVGFAGKEKGGKKLKKEIYGEVKRINNGRKWIACKDNFAWINLIANCKKFKLHKLFN